MISFSTHGRLRRLRLAAMIAKTAAETALAAKGPSALLATQAKDDERAVIIKDACSRELMGLGLYPAMTLKQIAHAEVRSITATSQRLYVLGETWVTSPGDDGWCDESPPERLLQPRP